MDPVAIVGAQLRLPGADSLDALWARLLNPSASAAAASCSEPDCDAAARLAWPGTTGRIYQQFSLTIAKTAEEAERRYMASGLVAHRKSLAYTGRDLTKQVVANLVGSPDLILEKIEGLRKIGVDHACALMIPADSMAEFEDQVEWFAKTVRS